MPGCRIAVRLTPRGGVDRIEGVREDGELDVRVRAAPVRGSANRAMLLVLARSLDLPRSAVTIERGEAGRRKVVRLEGIDPSLLVGRWPGLRCTPIAKLR